MDTLTADERFKKLGLTLPPAPLPQGVYKPFLTVENLAYVSGHGPVKTDGTMVIGKVGKDLTMEAGKEAAQQVGLAILATLKHNLGSFNRIKRVVKVLGMVNAVTDFERHPSVVNGCSELFAKVWGESNGVGVRSAVGMGSLPDNIPVEIEAIFEMEP